MVKVFHENFGTIDRVQLSVYKRFNVSQSDHDDIVDVFKDDHEAIIKHVRENSRDGMYQPHWGWQTGQRTRLGRRL
jgi:predicted thioredoxin/glutaredoxin